MGQEKKSLSEKSPQVSNEGNRGIFHVISASRHSYPDQYHTLTDLVHL